MSSPATPAAVAPAPAQAAPAPSAPKDALAAAPAGEATPAPAPKQPDRTASAWEKITKAEARVREEQARTKAEREAFAKEQAAHAEMQKLLTEDPVAWAEKYAPKTFYEDLTKRYMNGNKPSAEELIRKQQEETAALKKQLEDRDKAEQEREAQRRGKEYLSSLENTVADAKYELLRAYSAEEAVTNLAISSAQETGQLLTAQEVADRIQAEIEETHLPKLAKSKAALALILKHAPKELLDELLGPRQASPDQGQESPGGPAKTPQTKTLTNNSAAAGPAGSVSGKTKRERLAQAAALIRMLPEA